MSDDSSNSTAEKATTSAPRETPPAAGIPEIKRPRMFVVATVLSAFVMALLPLMYFGMIALVAWLAISGLLSFTIWGFLAATVWLALLVFMIKPLLVQLKSDQVESIELSPDDEAKLFAHVRSISDLIGAPPPTRIRVMLETNASAGFGTGLTGLFGRQLTLTVGLPLAAGMSVQQLSGVIAHELGHFTQRRNLRMAHTISVVNAWFAHVVYHRDWLDYKLIQQSRHGFVFIRPICSVARFLVWVVRRVLWLLMVTGHVASCFVLRQCEFDADQYEAYTSGSRSFAATCRSMVLLQMASRVAWNDVETAWQERRLGDSMPALIVSRAHRIPKEKRDNLLTLALDDQAGIFDTHPPTLARIQAAWGLREPGVLQDKRPARLLFSDLGGLCRRATMDAYRQLLGKRLIDAELISTTQLVKEQTATTDAYRALNRFFQGEFLFIRPSFPSSKAAKPASDPEAALKELKKSRKAMLWHIQHVQDALRRFDQADSKEIVARQALALVSAKVRFDPAAFGLMNRNQSHVAQTIDQLTSRQKKINEDLKEYDRHAMVRQTRALQLLHDARVFARLPKETAERDREQTATLLALCLPLKKAAKQVSEVRESMCVLVALLDHFGENYARSWIASRLMQESRRLASRIGEVHTTLMGHAFPFPHADGRISVAKYLIATQPDPDNPLEVLDASSSMIDQYDSLLARVLANLALVAEKVESAIGFQPLEEPKEKDELAGLIEEKQRMAEENRTVWAKLTAAYPWALQISMTLALVLIVVLGIAFSSYLVSALQRMSSARILASQPVAEQREHKLPEPAGVHRRPDAARSDTSGVRSGDRNRPTGIASVSEAVAALKSRNYTAQKRALDYLNIVEPDPDHKGVSQGLLIAIDSSQSSVRQSAFDLLQRWSPDAGEAAVARMWPRLASSSARREALAYFAHLQTPSALEALAAGLASKEYNTAADLLNKVGTPAESAVLRYVDHYERRVRYEAISILKRIGTERSVPVLMRALNDGDTGIASQARSALSRLAPQTVDQISTILRDLESPERSKVNRALSALATVKKDARLAGVELKIVPFLVSKDSSQQRLALEAMERWLTPECTPALVEAMEATERVYDKRRFVKLLVLTKDPQAVPAILAFSKDDPKLAKQALIAIGPVAEDNMITLLKHPDAYVRYVAIEILARTGTSKSIKPLIVVIGDDDSRISRGAREALKMVRARQDAAAVPD